MGHIYALCGPSGVGKTSLLKEVFEGNASDLNLLVRSTTRPIRPNEHDGFEYNYYSHNGFLQKLSSNDFVHVETYANQLYGIENEIIKKAIYDKNDSVIMAGIYGALKLKASFPECISILYMHSGYKNTILDPDCLNGTSKEILELERRLKQKIETGLIGQVNNPSEYISRRMKLNFLDLAHTIGKIRAKEDLIVLENIKDQLHETVNQFTMVKKARENIKDFCFVLMPFRKELSPIYEDHIANVLENHNMESLRADGIFSNKPIIEDIIESVRKSKIVIADLTDGNPNVFYETGYCHALGKEVILITQDSDVPFDLRHIRHIRYDYTPRGMAEFENKLDMTVKNILNKNNSTQHSI